MSNTKSELFKLEGAFAPKYLTPVATLFERLLERTLALHRLNDLYQKLPPAKDTDQFLQQVLETFNVRYEINGELSELIPREGAGIIVANHPFGVIEGVVLASLLRRYRSDVRIMANYFLCSIPELRDLFIGVDPFGGSHAARHNHNPLRQALRWLLQGGLMVIFPAGEVSHLHVTKRCVTDPPWSSTIGRLGKRAKASITPVFIEGRNSTLFQISGIIHPRLRTALLFRELINKQDQTVRIHFSETISAKRISTFVDDQELVDYLRFRTYLTRELKDRKCHDRTKSSKKVKQQTPIEAPVSPALLAEEVTQLPHCQRLEQQGQLEVYWARAGQIPATLREIGRLRELTFRATGEGTGNSLDLDSFDNYYLHLFVWDTEQRGVIGAYRLGLADRLNSWLGRKGLYTYSLYKYSKALLDQINPALELGRSFVRLEWQRNYAPLMLLWKGIGHFVAERPQYRILFGPVSMSDDYHTLSQRLMVDFLQTNRLIPQLADYVKPRHPLGSQRRGLRRDFDFPKLKDIEGLSDLISLIEGYERNLPVLLKQYLKLGGQVIGFNIDNQFGNCLDALIVVDLLSTDHKILRRYMGDAGANAFCSYHRRSEEEVQLPIAV